MNKEKINGAANDAAGRIKRQAGEWTGDVNKQMEGTAQQLKGKVQKAVGNVKDAAKDAENDAKRRDAAKREEAAMDNHQHEREVVITTRERK